MMAVTNSPITGDKPESTEDLPGRHRRRRHDPGQYKRRRQQTHPRSYPALLKKEKTGQVDRRFEVAWSVRRSVGRSGGLLVDWSAAGALGGTGDLIAQSTGYKTATTFTSLGVLDGTTRPFTRLKLSDTVLAPICRP